MAPSRPFFRSEQVKNALAAVKDKSKAHGVQSFHFQRSCDFYGAAYELGCCHTSTRGVGRLTVNTGTAMNFLSYRWNRLIDSACSSQLFITVARRNMSKYMSKAAKKRLVLSTKRVRKGFYKGNGATSQGRLTSKGRFISDPLKKLELVIPDLTGFKLKPYIARSVPKHPPEEQLNPIPR